MVKPICSEPFSAASQRRLALLDVARDVLDHHDRVVDDEAGRDRQRHQRQVVEAEAEQVHHAEGADQRQRHREARDDRRAAGCAGTGRSPARPARSRAPARTARRAPRRGSSSVRSVSTATSTAGGSEACSCGSSALMRSTTSMTLAPGWRWTLRMIAGVVVHPGRRAWRSRRRRRRRRRRAGAPARRCGRR